MTKFAKVLAAGAAAAMLLGAGACGASNSGSGSDSKTATITVWSAAEDQAKKDSWLQTMEAAFEKEHPEYKITWKNSVVTSADAATTVKQDPAAAADVYQFASDQLGALVDAQAIGELSDDATKQVKEQNDETLVNSVTGTDGKLYGVPLSGNTWFMYYNKSKFSADDIKSFNTMLEKGKVTFNIANSWYLPSFYVGDGMTIFGKKGTDAKAGIQPGSHAAEVTEFLTSLMKNPNFVLDNNADNAGLAAMKNGTADVYFSGTWSAQDMKEALGDNYAAAQLPSFTLDSGTYQMKSFAGSTSMAYNPNAKNAKIAAQFAAFLGSTQAQKKHYEMRQIIPADKSLESMVADDPAAKAQIDTLANTSIIQPTLTEMSNFWDPCENFGTAITTGDVTAANAAEKTQAWFDAYKK
ncbi:extracellular solute-binding protein [Alloscardovia sp. HMSC034E08]|uniref:extracellular solute-binding protein n=1 Tax=Alloscardovia sp. HMSC034E08 TaxID=1739413 RepID=UPI0008BD151C|nr:extracellular solute-binding protein [Alloscardovia sp. HMSC034E08]OFQ97702.1 ABC transporter substrate-binding protein [Alloscardovia sp. HMSC034E08]